MRRNNFLLLLIYLLFFNSLNADIKVVKKIRLKVVDIDKDSPSKVFYIDPPVKIYEGYYGEFIIVHDTFIEVFKDIYDNAKNIGRRGNGPGEFTGIISFNKYKNKYYIHNRTNKIIIFDKNLKYERSFYLSAMNTSRIINSLDIKNNKIICEQNFIKNNEISKDVLCLYNDNGKLINHFFDNRILLKIYDLYHLTRGQVSFFNNNIVFAMMLYPKIYLFSINGKLIKFKEYDFKWWQKIVFNKKKYEESKRKIGLRALVNMLASSTIVYSINKYKNYLLIHIVNNVSSEPHHSVIILDKDLNLVEDIYRFKDYEYCNSSENYLYYAKEIKYFKKENSKEVEILKCLYLEE